MSEIQEQIYRRETFHNPIFLVDYVFQIVTSSRSKSGTYFLQNAHVANDCH